MKMNDDALFAQQSINKVMKINVKQNNKTDDFYFVTKTIVSSFWKTFFFHLNVFFVFSSSFLPSI